MVGLYKRKVAVLEEALADPEIRSEAREILRGMVDRIEITPGPNTTGHSGGDNSVPDAEISPQSSGVAVILYGELAAVIGLAEENETIESKRRFSLSAGARNQFYLLFMVKWPNLGKPRHNRCLQNPVRPAE